MEWVHLQTRLTEDCQGPPEPEREAWNWLSPSEFVDTLVLDFWRPELGEKKLVFWGPSVWSNFFMPSWKTNMSFFSLILSLQWTFLSMLLISCGQLVFEKRWESENYYLWLPLQAVDREAPWRSVMREAKHRQTCHVQAREVSSAQVSRIRDKAEQEV